MLFQSFAIFFNNLKKENELLSIDFTYSNNGLPVTSDHHLASVLTPLLGSQNWIPWPHVKLLRNYLKVKASAGYVKYKLYLNTDTI